MVKASVDYLAGQLSNSTTDELRWGVDFFALPLAIQPVKRASTAQSAPCAPAR